MKTQVLLRKIHHWGSIIIAPVLIVMIGAGVLLQLKKEIDWIQPPASSGTAFGARSALPAASLARMFEAAKGVPQAGINSWADLTRVDIKPERGMVKFVSASSWEVQVDTATAKVLQVAYRRSDLIETIHDGSFFADWAKLYVFLPAGVGLLVLWLTGVYLFALTEIKKAGSRRKRRQRRAGSGTGTGTGHGRVAKNLWKRVSALGSRP